MVTIPGELRSALDGALETLPLREVRRSVNRLIDSYRDGDVPSSPILLSPADVAAYAAYRMPATYAAVHSALAQAAPLLHGFRPRSHLDIGGGTGAAVWGAAQIWPSIESAEVLEQVPDVAALGRRLAAHAGSESVRRAYWRRFTIGPAAQLPDADLITMSYVLGELPEAHRPATIGELAAHGRVVALVEPGTPAGYRRILAARDLLIERGMTVVAPCPHEGRCPLAGVGGDWCHFAARVNRSSLHRRVKSAALGHEDEKFSYVVAVRGAGRRAANRVLRHPQRGKRIVTFRLCGDDHGLAAATVAKSQGTVYRAARDTGWGDPWPPIEADPPGAL